MGDPSAASLPTPCRTLPIGIFDSGVGGLTVAAALRRRLPAEHLLYLGDMARLPYGTKSPETVLRYAAQAGRFLAARGIKLLVVACNTASAHALGHLAESLPPLPVLGVVEAGAAAAAGAAADGRILVLATEGTCASGAFPRAIAARRPGAQVRQIPCPLFVALAEEGLAEGAIAEAVARHYLQGSDGEGTVVLGCTHFPLLVPTLRRVLGPRPTLVDCGEAVAEATAALLAERGLAAPEDSAGGVSLAATDTADRFARLAFHLLPELGPRPPVERVDLKGV